MSAKDATGFTEKANAALMNQLNWEDKTDFEKALDFLIEKGFRDFFVIGSSGKEHDHFLSNLVITSKYSDISNIILFGDDYSIQFVKRENAKFKADKAGSTVVSLFGWPNVTFSRSTGLKFPVDGLTLNEHFSGSRNIAVKNNIEIEAVSGSYFIFINESPIIGIESANFEIP